MAAVESPSASDTSYSASHVHFDNTCVLIPDPVAQSRMPRLVKKSYSLPIWKKRAISNPPPGVVETAPGPASPTEERGMVFTVSVPRSVMLLSFPELDISTSLHLS